jgi:hypothetical protein
VNGNHFRTRAATARAMAETGSDPRLSLLLLELARDLEAEADAMETNVTSPETRTIAVPAPTDPAAQPILLSGCP